MANVFTEASAYVKKHPRTSFQDAIQIVSKKKKKAAKKKPAAKKKVARKKATVGRAHKKKKAAAKKKAPRKAAAAKKPAARKIKVKIKPKKGQSSITIGSINKMHQEHSHLKALEDALHKHKSLLKERGLTPGEKAAIRRDIKKYQNNIRASKAHISALKRSI